MLLVGEQSRAGLPISEQVVIATRTPLPLRGRGRDAQAARVRVIGSPCSACLRVGTLLSRSVKTAYVPARSPSPSMLRIIDLSRAKRGRGVWSLPTLCPTLALPLPAAGDDRRKPRLPTREEATKDVRSRRTCDDLAVQRAQRSAVPRLYRSRAIRVGTGANLQGADVELSMPGDGDCQSRGLCRDHHRRGTGDRGARRRRAHQRLRQPLRASRQPAVL